MPGARETMKRENIEKAAQGAQMLRDDIQAAHRDAIEAGNGMAEIVLLALIGEAAQLAEKINIASTAAWPNPLAVKLADAVAELMGGHSIEGEKWGREAIEAADAAGII